MREAATHNFNEYRTTNSRAYTFADLSAYTWKQRFAIRTADLAFYTIIKLLGSSVRWQIEGWQHWEAITEAGHLPIYVNWHSQIFLSTYFWRDRRIVVMTSQSFDGEYIARFIQRFGYGAARGSSTRGGVGAIVEMVRLMRAGSPGGFTIDGPKGPRHVAKMGAVLLAKKTGQPIMPFGAMPMKRWTINNSWDQTEVPKPFSRALLSIAPPIYVPADADEEVLSAKRDELQSSLDSLNEQGESWRLMKNS